MNLKTFIIIPFLYILHGCSVNSEDSLGIVYTDLDVVKEISGYSKILSSKNINQIKKISTQKGLESLLGWSDSLRKTDFIEMLSNDLSNKQIIYTSTFTNEFEIETGNNTGRKLDLPSGSLSFIKVGKKFKIDGYAGE